MQSGKKEGYIWFEDKFYGGFEEDYEAACMAYEDVRLVMKFYVESMKEVQVVVINLNNSNIPKSFKS